METLKTILSSDVYDETFQIAFYSMLEKFVIEFDDMSQMKAIQQAKRLLDTLNN